MDPATVLEDYLSEITNLPTDLAFILDEIHGYEEQLRDVQRKTLQRETINQKFIKTHGSLAENPKEAASLPRIRQEYQQALALQEDKCNLANTGLYIVSRYVKRLEDQIRVLERDGVIPQMQIESLGEGFMPVKHTRRERPSTSTRSSYTPRQSGGPTQQSPSTPARTHTAASGERLLRRQRLSEDHEEEKYCICNQKSFGDMVGCDNDNCPNEWFHWECVGLTEAPTGVWFCPSCRKK